MYRCQKDLSFI